MQFPGVTGTFWCRTTVALNFLSGQHAMILSKVLGPCVCGSAVSIVHITANQGIYLLITIKESSFSDSTCFYCQKRPQTLRSSVARELATVLDTSLLQALILTRQSSGAVELLKGLNYCDLKICEEFLKERSDYMVLIELYRSNDMHREALQLLNQLVEKSKSEMANTDSIKKINPQMIIEYLRVLFFLLYYQI
jgi:hypothetical protein